MNHSIEFHQDNSSSYALLQIKVEIYTSVQIMQLKAKKKEYLFQKIENLLILEK